MAGNKIPLSGNKISLIVATQDIFELNLPAGKSRARPSRKIKGLNLEEDEELSGIHAQDHSTIIDLFPRNLEGSQRIAAALARFGHKFDAHEQKNAISCYRVYGARLGDVASLLRNENIIEDLDFNRITQSQRRMDR